MPVLFWLLHSGAVWLKVFISKPGPLPLAAGVGAVDRLQFGQHMPQVFGVVALAPTANGPVACRYGQRCLVQNCRYIAVPLLFETAGIGGDTGGNKALFQSIGFKQFVG